MIELVPAAGAALEQILDATYDIWNEGLSRQAYARYYGAQVKTAWGVGNFVQYAIAKKRLLAGLGPAGARELWCFIAEEGASAVAFVMASVGRRAREADWT
jgi:hypothetical protein